jgi:hypothetical protein
VFCDQLVGVNVTFTRKHLHIPQCPIFISGFNVVNDTFLTIETTQRSSQLNLVASCLVYSINFVNIKCYCSLNSALNETYNSPYRNYLAVNVEPSNSLKTS